MNTQPVEAHSTASNWQIGMERFLKTEVEYHRATRGKDDGAIDDAANAHNDARWDLMRMPAPDLAALRWKLDYILEGSNGSTDVWELSTIEPMKRDMQRLMQSGQDDTIKLAWARRLTALRIYNTLPEGERGRDSDTDSAIAAKCWEEIDSADEEIRKATATTIEGARIQLHCAILGMIGTQQEEAALLAGDMVTFAKREDHLDYPIRLAFSALRSLSAMELAA